MEKLNLSLNKIGIDLVHLVRFEDKITNEKFINKVLTKNEQVIFKQLDNPQRKIQFLAGRFACKEAYAKALKKGIGLVNFHDIEVLYDELKAPCANKKNVEVSISHDGEYVIAMVMVGDEDE